MYKRHTGQVSMLESPEMFGSLPLDPNNDWIKLSKYVPWREFDLKYADNFRIPTCNTFSAFMNTGMNARSTRA